MVGNSLGYMATTCLVLLVGGCSFHEGATVINPGVPAHSMPRREDYSLELPANQARSQNKAVLALLDIAIKQAGAGDYDKAAASLERALHIEPRNAYLYNRLADIRLQQKRYDEAEALAAKSNSLASRDAYLQEANWRLIVTARKAQGDDEGAARAEQRAAQLREFIND